MHSLSWRGLSLNTRRLSSRSRTVSLMSSSHVSSTPTVTVEEARQHRVEVRPDGMRVVRDRLQRASHETLHLRRPHHQLQRVLLPSVSSATPTKLTRVCTFARVRTSRNCTKTHRSTKLFVRICVISCSCVASARRKSITLSAISRRVASSASVSSWARWSYRSPLSRVETSTRAKESAGSSVSRNCFSDSSLARSDLRPTQQWTPR